MFSAATLVILDRRKMKSPSPLLVTVSQEEHHVFIEMLAKEKRQKSRVTVFFDDKKQPFANLIINLLFFENFT